MSHQKNINLTANQTKNLSKLEFSATPTLGGGGVGGGITHLRQVSLLHRHLLNLLITLAVFTLLLSCGIKDTEPSTSSAVVRINATNTLQSIIEGGTLAGLENSTVSLVTNTLTHLTTRENYERATIEARYATESGAGLQNGTSWANAWAATDLRGGINGISDATNNKVYAVLVASGTYKPVTTTTATANTNERGISFAMKNHVAIIGGFTSTGSWERSGTTTFSGDIGEGSTSDNSYQVFSHISITLDNGLLYGVTITGGNANNIGSSIQNSGGGMYNDKSSPRLVEVRFVNNSTRHSGGGMYNSGSSPVLTGVVFTDNSADQGGGVYNNGSSPVFRGVVFSGNRSTATSLTGFSIPIPRGGGGMWNNASSPVLRGVVFDGNSATGGEGGGMYNSDSSLVLVGVVFRGNSAKNNGGGMYSYNIKTGAELVIVNSIFVSNSATTGKDIVLDRSGSGNNINVRVAGSVLGVGKANVTNGILVTNTAGAGGAAGSFDITYHSLATGDVNFDSDTTTGGLTYPTIRSTSSAVDVGLYVKRKGTTNYFSQDNSSWYTKFLATGGFDSSSTATPPTGAEDLTATDIAGNARVGRPDAGVHEYTP